MSPPRSYQRSSTAPRQLHPDASDIAEVFGMRWRELDTISNRLQRMTKFRWDKLFTAAFVLLVGGSGGGAFGLLQFLAQNPAPSHRDKIEYFAAIAITAFVAAVCGLASLCIKGERDDSVAAIKEDLDRLLKPYREKIEETEEAMERQRRAEARKK